MKQTNKINKSRLQNVSGDFTYRKYKEQEIKVKR